MPNGYGAQHLYTITISLAVGGVVQDHVVKTTGIRQISWGKNPASKLAHNFSLNWRTDASTSANFCSNESQPNYYCSDTATVSTESNLTALYTDSYFNAQHHLLHCGVPCQRETAQ